MYDFYCLSPAPLYEVKRANLITAGKDYQYTKYMELTETQQVNKWKELFLAEHSTLAFAPFVVIGDFRSDVIHQLTRHTKGLPRFSVQSSRPDLTGQTRPSSDTLRKMTTLWNPISWMAMCRERLCHLAMKETREAILTISTEMRFSSNPFFKALGLYSRSMCEYRMGCPYGKRCCGNMRRLDE